LLVTPNFHFSGECKDTLWMYLWSRNLYFRPR